MKKGAVATTPPSINLLVASFLRKSGFTESLRAFASETGLVLEEVPEETNPALSELVGEWEQLRAIVSRSSESSESAVDLEELLSDVAREKVLKGQKSSVSASAALCCAFDAEGELWWGEAGRTLHTGRNGTLQLSAALGGILCVAVDGESVVLGTMSGSIVVVDRGSRQIVRTLEKAHQKYVHRATIVSGRQLLVTASHDHTVSVWNMADEYRRVQQFKYGAVPEGIAASDTRLFIAVRETHLLQAVELDALVGGTAEPVGLNVNSLGDDHVSFSMLDVAVTRNSIVALASDRDRVFVYWVTEGACKLLQTLTGMASDSLAAARCQFSQSGRLLFTSSADGCVCVFDTATGQLLERLKRHKSGVRDLAVFRGDDDCLVASVSFDKTCIVSTVEDDD